MRQPIRRIFAIRIFSLRILSEGIVLVFLGGVILLLVPFQIDIIPGMDSEVSPAFLPIVLSVAIMAVGAGMVLRSFLRVSEGKPVDLKTDAVLRVVATVLLLVAYTFLFPRIGFVVTSAVFIGIFVYLFGSRDALKILLSMVLVPVAVWLFFEKLFHIPLPHGIIF